MNNPNIFQELERNAEVISALLCGTSVAEYQWRPAEEKWNLLDVACHLRDEEVEDFRARVKSILTDPDQNLVPIDPQNWPKSRNYQDQDFETVIQEFVHAREESIQWLRDLKDPKWSNSFKHPKVGPVSAQLVLDNWLAHDLLHIRQILSIKYHYLKESTSNPLDYAGNW